MATLIAVTKPVPNFLVSLSLNKLDVIVPPLIIMEIIPAYDNGAENSTRMTGHAAPNSESGKPKLIKLTYIIVINNPNITPFVRHYSL